MTVSKVNVEYRVFSGIVNCIPKYANMNLTTTNHRIPIMKSITLTQLRVQR